MECALGFCTDSEAILKSEAKMASVRKTESVLWRKVPFFEINIAYTAYYSIYSACFYYRKHFNYGLLLLLSSLLLLLNIHSPHNPLCPILMKCA